jgi:hypothetical protein
MTAGVIAPGPGAAILGAWSCDTQGVLIGGPVLTEESLRDGFTFLVRFRAEKVVLELEGYIVVSGPRYLKSGVLSTSSRGQQVYLIDEVPAPLRSAVHSLLVEASDKLSDLFWQRADP